MAMKIIQELSICTKLGFLGHLNFLNIFEYRHYSDGGDIMCIRGKWYSIPYCKDRDFQYCKLIIDLC